MTDERSRSAVEGAERAADGQASPIELETAQLEARAAVLGSVPSRGRAAGTRAWRDERVMHAVTRAAWLTVSNPQYARYAAEETAAIAQQRGLAWSGGTGNWQCDLLHCLFGNPFRPAPRIDPSWLAWNDSTVKRLAEAIYEGRAFDRLPILADALEEAGCDEPELLLHLRGAGPHVKGCWALDSILGKQ
jgi:hypothetical protein